MSAVVKTLTPFIDKEILLKALDKLGVKYKLNGDNIITERRDYYGQQIFIWEDHVYKFRHDSSAELSEYLKRWGHYPNGWKENWKDWNSVSSFLQAVEKEYNKLYKEKLAELERKRLQEERRRMEEQRKSMIEKQKQQIIEKAREKGYYVKEKKVGNKIKLILVRHTQ